MFQTFRLSNTISVPADTSTTTSSRSKIGTCVKNVEQGVVGRGSRPTGVGAQDPCSTFITLGCKTVCRVCSLRANLENQETKASKTVAQETRCTHPSGSNG